MSSRSRRASEQASEPVKEGNPLFDGSLTGGYTYDQYQKERAELKKARNKGRRIETSEGYDALVRLMITHLDDYDAAADARIQGLYRQALGGVKGRTSWPRWSLEADVEEGRYTNLEDYFLRLYGRSDQEIIGIFREELQRTRDQYEAEEAVRPQVEEFIDSEMPDLYALYREYMDSITPNDPETKDEDGFIHMLTKRALKLMKLASRKDPEVSEELRGRAPIYVIDWRDDLRLYHESRIADLKNIRELQERDRDYDALNDAGYGPMLRAVDRALPEAFVRDPEDYYLLEDSGRRATIAGIVRSVMDEQGLPAEASKIPKNAINAAKRKAASWPTEDTEAGDLPDLDLGTKNKPEIRRMVPTDRFTTSLASSGGREQRIIDEWIVDTFEFNLRRDMQSIQCSVKTPAAGGWETKSLDAIDTAITSYIGSRLIANGEIIGKNGEHTGKYKTLELKVAEMVQGLMRNEDADPKLSIDEIEERLDRMASSRYVTTISSVVRDDPEMRDRLGPFAADSERPLIPNYVKTTWTYRGETKRKWQFDELPTDVDFSIRMGEWTDPPAEIFATPKLRKEAMDPEVAKWANDCRLLSKKDHLSMRSNLENAGLKDWVIRTIGAKSRYYHDDRGAVILSLNDAYIQILGKKEEELPEGKRRPLQRNIETYLGYLLQYTKDHNPPNHSDPEKMLLFPCGYGPDGLIWGQITGIKRQKGRKNKTTGYLIEISTIGPDTKPEQLARH